MKINKEDVLKYHRDGRPGKIEVKPSKSLLTSRDLSLAYTPGVAHPCLDIASQPQLVFDYTAKGNLVGVVTNGSAVLGLGNIGPLAAKPVMEGKGVLFKKFADIDVFDIELNVDTAEQFVQAVQALEPTFGGINLEDISAPDCFFIEEELKKRMKIPVFHDDQHGTAIISAAAMINALEITGKKAENLKVVFNGAGSAGIACCNLFFALGVKPENVIMCDSKGVIYQGRTESMNPYKEKLAVDTDLRTLSQAMVGADAFVGVSVKDALSVEMLQSMAEQPIVFALANPDPEIDYEVAKAARPDAIIATGRSDYPNQVNNVLGFPFIFRGALDCQATEINEEMKLAAARALSGLAKQDVPDYVLKAYDSKSIHFGPDYLIPKPFDSRIMLWVSPAVAEAAGRTGVAGQPIKDFESYRYSLEALQGKSRQVMRTVINKARLAPQSIVFPEGDHPKILQAAQIVIDEKIGIPILLGKKQEIAEVVRSHEIQVDLDQIKIIDPATSDFLPEFCGILYEKRQRKGISRQLAQRLMLRNRNYFAAAMVQTGHANALISGISSDYSYVLKPCMHLVDVLPEVHRITSLHMIMRNQRIYFFADTVVNIAPDAETLAAIALQTAQFARELNVEPRVALISYSNFGSTLNDDTQKIAAAVKLIKKRDPSLNVDGEMMVDYALNPEIRDELYPFSTLKGPANIFVFPELNSANIAFRMMNRLGGAEKVGPVLMGFSKSIHVLQRECDIQEIVNMAAISAMDANEKANGTLSSLESQT